MYSWLVVQFYDEDHRHRLGSDGTAIFKDLKTVQGAERRLRDCAIPSWARTYEIFRVPAEKFYSDAAWKQVAGGHVDFLRPKSRPTHGDSRGGMRWEPESVSSTTRSTPWMAEGRRGSYRIEHMVPTGGMTKAYVPFGVGDFSPQDPGTRARRWVILTAPWSSLERAKAFVEAFDETTIGVEWNDVVGQYRVKGYPRGFSSPRQQQHGDTRGRPRRRSSRRSR